MMLERVFAESTVWESRRVKCNSKYKFSAINIVPVWILELSSSRTRSILSLSLLDTKSQSGELTTTFKWIFYVIQFNFYWQARKSFIYTSQQFHSSFLEGDLFEMSLTLLTLGLVYTILAQIPAPVLLVYCLNLCKLLFLWFKVDYSLIKTWLICM